MDGATLHCPLDRNQVTRAVDIGCGTGIVTDRLASNCPQAEVYGLDMSPVPKLRDHPPNVRFLQGNVLYQQPSQWVTEEGNPFLPGDSVIFDFAFSRLLVAGMTDWPGYISQVYQMLKPGGWAELQEMMPHLYDANGAVLADAEWYKTLTAYQKSKGLDVYVVDRVPEMMTEAGFRDIEIKEYRLPLELGADAGDKKQAAA